MRKNIKNIGTIKVEDITLLDTTISIYIPFETLDPKVEAEKEKFHKAFENGQKLYHLEIDQSKCTLFTETDLFVNTQKVNDKYILDFSIGFICWLEDENGEELYWDASDQFNIALTEEDKDYVKRIMAEKIIEVMM